MDAATDTPALPSCLSTGSFGLDLALGSGVRPGSLVEFCGPAESGKTTLAQHLAAHCQGSGRAVVWIDGSQSFDPAYARRCGVNLDPLVIGFPGWLEAALEMAERLAASGGAGLIVMDGLDALPDWEERSRPVGENSLISGLDGQASLEAEPRLSPWLRRVVPLLHHWQTSLVITHSGPAGAAWRGGKMPVSQVYHQLAGNLGRLALPLQADLRLRLLPLGLVRRGRTVVGRRIRARILKYSLKTCLLTTEFDIMYSQGVLRSSEVLDLGIRLGTIHLKGSGYAFQQVDLGIGHEQAVHTLQYDELLRETIERVLSQEMYRS